MVRKTLSSPETQQVAGSLSCLRKLSATGDFRSPGAVVAFSPWLDLSGSGPDQPGLARRDPMLTMDLGRRAAAMWIGGVPANDPRVSPLFGRRERIAPVILFSGDRDLLDSNVLRFKIRNPFVTHKHYPGMFQVWVAFPFPKSIRALDGAARFIQEIETKLGSFIRTATRGMDAAV